MNDDSGAIFHTLCSINDSNSNSDIEHCKVDNDKHYSSELNDDNCSLLNDTNHDVDDKSHKSILTINNKQNTDKKKTPHPHNINTITIDHHIYNDLIHAWERRSSDPQPFIDVSISAEPADFRDLGHTPAFTATAGPAVIPAMADTGCQSTLAGVTILNKLGLNPDQLWSVAIVRSGQPSM